MRHTHQVSLKKLSSILQVARSDVSLVRKRLGVCLA